MEILKSDMVVVGHFSIDSIKLPKWNTPFVTLGGAVTYVSMISRKLGKTVSIISKIGMDFPKAYLWLLDKKGVDLSNIVKLKNEKTTSFELEYDNNFEKRILKLRYKTSSLQINDLPSNFEAKVIHLAPIADEISYQEIVKLRKNTKVLSLDPQGLLRNFSDNGSVRLESNFDNKILNLIDIFKSTSEEIKKLTNQSNLKLAIETVHNFGVKIIIVTQGSKGSTLSIGENQYSVPTYHSKCVVDPTGAGDCFIGGFLTEFIDQKDTLWCACVGSAAASIIIEKMGPISFGKREEIYQRAYAIYEKETKRL
jgi:sugar/nucleoside kinase (ribokinase family)